MPWRIQRYIIREILPYFLLTLLITTIVILANEAGRFSELFVKRNVPPALVRTLLVAVLTRILIITLPISLLIGILLGLARMSSDHEIISIFAGGVSRKQFVIPLLMVSAPVSMVLAALTLIEFPHSATRIREIRGQLILQGIRTQVKPRVFDSRFVDRILYIRDIDRKTDQWEGLFLASVEPGQVVLMTGKRGILELSDQPESSELHLFDGVAHRIEMEKDGSEGYHLEGFSSYHVRFDPQSREAAKFQLEAQREPEPIEEKSFTELLHLRSTDQKQYIKARVEAGRRLAVPFACLLFAPIGLAIGVLRRPAGRSVGFIFGVGLAACYYLLLFAGEKLARSGLLPPFSAMWLANGVFALAGGLGFQERWPLSQGGQGVKVFAPWRRKVSRDPALSKHNLVASETSPIWRWLPWTGLVDQYLVTDFLKFLLLAIVSFWFVFIVFTLFELSPDIVEHGISVASVLSYLFYLSPQIVLTVAPPCVLIASLLVVGLLRRTNQLAALKGSGMSAYRVSLPVLLSCLALVFMAGAWMNWVVPKANVRQDQLRFYIKKGRLPTPMELSPLSQDENWMYGKASRVFHFERFDREHDEFQRPWILDLDEADRTIRRRIEAARAAWVPEKSEWFLHQARIWEFNRDRLLRSESLDTYALRLEETPAYFKKDIKKPEYMSGPELAVHIAELQQSGFDVTELRIALQRKLALPVACLVMGLVGVPFGFTLGRRGALYGIGLGLLLGLIYWMGLGFFEELGRYEYVRPELAGWGPGGLFGALGLYFLFRVRT